MTVCLAASHECPQGVIGEPADFALFPLATAPAVKVAPRCSALLTAGGASRVRVSHEPNRTKVEIYQPTITSRSYITDFEGELTKKLEDGTCNITAIVGWVSEKILESFKNGVIADKKGARKIRKEQNANDVSTSRAE